MITRVVAASAGHAGHSRRVAIAVAAWVGAAVYAGGVQPEQRLRIAWDPAAEPARLEVSVEALGLADEAGPLALVLGGWGEWMELEREYVTIVSAEPPLGEREGTAFRVLAPPGWDGVLRVTYALPLLAIGSEEQLAHTILPASDGAYALAALANTVPHLERAGEAVGGGRTITIDGPAGSTVFTGWAGVSEGSQTSTLPPLSDNAVFAIGRAVEVVRAEVDGIELEVCQFAAGAGLAPKLLEVTRSLVACVSETLGCPPPGPVRVCVSGTTSGGFLTDHGLVVGFPPGTPDWAPDNPYYRHMVCHELFHTWNGHVLKEAGDEGVVWFKEGFTDYLSLWHGAACGVLAREWFAVRLLEIEQDARGSSFGTVAFADPAVEWRDGNGPNETMAYKGGAVLAFALDAELRRAGKGGLPRLLGDMIRSGERVYSADSVRERVRGLGLEEFDRRFIAGTEVPSVCESLLALGYEVRGVETDLAYVGLQTEAGEAFGRVSAIDPEGPGAHAGFRVGDIIGGMAPARGETVGVSDGVTTPFRFGLELIAPTEDEVSIWVHRGGDPVEIKVRPRLIPGGTRDELFATPASDALLFPGE